MSDPNFKPSPYEVIRMSTIRIECEVPNGVSAGTGFFWRTFECNGVYGEVIVTNKHVIKDATLGRLRFTLANANGRGPDMGNIFTLEIPEFEKLWIHHPDPKIDIAVLPAVPILAFAAKKTGRPIFVGSYGEELCPTDTQIHKMCGAEKVLIVGYPNGIWDHVNNQPVMRSGILASGYEYDWMGKPEFLVDAAIYSGSSGSPVFICDIGSVQTRDGTTMGASRILFLGVIHSTYLHTAEGIPEPAPIPTGKTMVSVPNNLGIAIKAEKVRELSAELNARMKAGDPLLIAKLQQTQEALALIP